MKQAHWCFFLLVPLFGLLAGCGRLTQAQLAATATTLGCWPYGQPLPRATRTALPTGTAAPGPSTPTPALVSPATPAATWAWCTPAPGTPTLTPTTTSSPTAWTRPTPRPVLDRSSRLMNVSNLSGMDREPVVALHPTEGWAALLWVNNAPGRSSEDTAIFVRVQDPRTGDWKRGSSVNTLGSYGFASNPDIAIDQSGRIHVVFGQAEFSGSSDALYPHYSFSDDLGATWSEPEPLPLPANGQGRVAVDMDVAVDPTGQLHILYAVSPCFDCFYHLHLARTASAAPHTAWQISYPPEPQSEANYQRAKLAFLQLPDGTVRTFLGAICFRGCVGPRRVRVFWRDEPVGSWQEADIPGADATHPDQAPFSLDALAFSDRNGRAWLCVAWGDYWRSAVFSSCSSDYGASWQVPQTIIYTEEADIPVEATKTPQPGVTPQAVPNEQFDAIDRGFAPALLYDADSHKLMAIWILRQAGRPNPSYLVYSYKKLDASSWTPYLNGTQEEHEPKLRLFEQTTRRNQASGYPSVVYAGSGLAYVAWMEIESDENIDVYLGIVSPNAMLAESDR